MVHQSPGSNIVFTVKRHKPELLAPAKLTPREIKLLSDIDDQDFLRAQIPFVHFYRHEPCMAKKDPVQVIRQALAQTLVFYYPFAGRLKEGDGRKLMVDCNGEGVMFIEADADVRLDEFCGHLQPPFPCFQDLLYDVPGSEGILHTPLLLIQVTRLNCGGFVLALRFNHTMCDGAGIGQFMKALAEIANGASEPSIKPVWHRDILRVRDPPRVTCTHCEFDEVAAGSSSSKDDVVVLQSFFLGPTEISAIRRLVPRHLTQSTLFEALTAFLWRCRTKALQLDPHEDVRMMFIVNTRYGRGRFNPPIPKGYYGNAFVYPAAITTAGKLCERPLGYALELVRKAKGMVSEEYVHSVIDLMVIKGRPCYTTARSWLVSDLTHFGFGDVDFGWGKAVYGGPANAGLGSNPGVSFYVATINAKGEEGIVVPIRLPSKAMKRFAKELDDVVKICNNNQGSTVINSSL